jgi:hypothetical protein
MLQASHLACLHAADATVVAGQVGLVTVVPRYISRLGGRSQMAGPLAGKTSVNASPSNGSDGGEKPAEA